MKALNDYRTAELINPPAWLKKIKNLDELIINLMNKFKPLAAKDCHAVADWLSIYATEHDEKLRKEVALEIHNRALNINSTVTSKASDRPKKAR